MLTETEGRISGIPAGIYRGWIHGFAVQGDNTIALHKAASPEFDDRGRLLESGRPVRRGDVLVPGCPVQEIIGFKDGLLIHHAWNDQTVEQFMIVEGDGLRVVILGRLGTAESRMEGVLLKG